MAEKENVARALDETARRMLAMEGLEADFLPGYRFRLAVADDEDGLEAADSIARLGGPPSVAGVRLRFDGRRLELRTAHVRGRPPLAERLVGSRWLRVDLFDRDCRGVRTIVFALAGEALPLLELDAADSGPAVDGAVWLEAELVRVEDNGKGKDP